MKKLGYINEFLLQLNNFIVILYICIYNCKKYKDYKVLLINNDFFEKYQNFRSCKACTCLI